MNLRLFYFAGFGVLMVFDTVTQISLKMAASRVGEFLFTGDYLREVVTTPWLYGAIGGYLCAFVTWMTLLKRAPIGPAFAASHIEIIPVLILSIFLFGESLNISQVIGCLCIVAGIVFLAMSKSNQPHD